MYIVRPVYIDQDSELTSTNVTEADYTEWATGQSITTGDYRQVTDDTVHKVYQAVQNHTSSAGDKPNEDTDNSHWVEISPTNRWAMFHPVAQHQTTRTGNIDVTFDVNQLTDALSFINIDGDSVQVIVTDTTDGEVYNETYTLVDNEGVNNWYSYYFEPISRKRDFVLVDIPLYSTTYFRVIITSGSGDAKCGIVIPGLKKYMGASQYGASFGIVDYSVKSVDDFGNATLTQRAYSRTMKVDLTLDKTTVDDIYNTLSDYRSTPLVWMASDEYNASIVYGYYRDFDVTVQYHSHSMCSLEVEGLT